MNINEFCSVCKHHFTFHEMGDGECKMLYPPRFINIENEYVRKTVKADRVYHSQVNFCTCKEFI